MSAFKLLMVANLRFQHEITWYTQVLRTQHHSF